MSGKRKHISLKTKLAAALIILGKIPLEDAKEMSDDQILSLFQWDHAVLHAVDPIDKAWNLTPRFISEHREKSRKDTTVVAKVKRIEKDWNAFTARMKSGEPKPQSKYRWGKRKLESRNTWQRKRKEK